MDRQRLIVALLTIVALLLAANLIVNLGIAPKTALADIVEGKNVLSTTSPDGETVYFWGYVQTGTINNIKLEGRYLGKATQSGFIEP
jgi:hypothetical protein